MKIPRKIMIHGMKFNVKRVKGLKDPSNQECLGLCEVDKCIVSLERDMPKEKEKEVLFHELIHAVDDNLNLGLNENVVNALGVELLSLIVTNKLDLLS